MRLARCLLLLLLLLLLLSLLEKGDTLAVTTSSGKLDRSAMLSSTAWVAVLVQAFIKLT